YLNDLKKEICKVIVGQEEVVDLIFISIIQKGHILFESVPGTGKTVLSKSVSKVMGGTFSRVQFTPDVLPTDITGMNIYNPKTEECELQPGPGRLVVCGRMKSTVPRRAHRQRCLKWWKRARSPSTANHTISRSRSSFLQHKTRLNPNRGLSICRKLKWIVSS